MKKRLVIPIISVLAAIVHAQNVGYLTPSRTYAGYGLNDYSMNQATKDVLDQGYTLVSVNEFSPSSLADIDIAFVGLGLAGNDGALSSDETASLYHFVLGGGSLILFGDNMFFDAFQNGVASLFGVRYNSEYYEGGFYFNFNASHPIISGPYGDVTFYSYDTLKGQILDLGPYAVSLINDEHGVSAAAIIDNNVLCEGSGRAIFLTDIGGFTDPSIPVPEGHRNVALWNNIFAYSVPEPMTFILLGLGSLFVRFRQ
ncbi:MAG: PEP-CTERM sorting domain-containing protein [Anaerohalosphaeraceae bacterium]